MPFRLEAPYEEPQFTLEELYTGEVPQPEVASFGSRVARKVQEAGETAQGGIEGFLETLNPPEPGEGFMDFATKKLTNTVRALMGPLAPVQAVTGAVVGAPVEHALASVLPEESAKMGGMIAEMGVPLVLGGLAQAGKIRIPNTRAGVMAQELLGIPREPEIPRVDTVLPRRTGTSAYRYNEPIPEGTQLDLRLPTEPAYRPTEAPIMRGPWPAEAYDDAIRTMEESAAQLPLFTAGVAHTNKVKVFREIAGRSPSGRELQLFKNLSQEDIKLMAERAKEVDALKARFNDPETAVAPTRAIAAATAGADQLKYADVADALGAHHIAEDIRQAVRDDLARNMDNWYVQMRPGGSTLAGSVAGSLAGFEKNDEGEYVFDPGKALVGGILGAGAVGAVTSPRLQQQVKGAATFLAKMGTFGKQAAQGARIPTTSVPDLTNTLLRKVVFPHTAAELEPGFAPIYATGLKFHENRALIGGTFAEMLGDVMQGVSKKLTETLYLGGMMRKEFTPAELARLGHTADEIRQYRQIRTALDFSLDAVERNLVQTGVDPAKASSIVGQLRKTGFMPQTRFGPYKIAIEDANGDLIGFFQSESKLDHQRVKGLVQQNLQPGERMRAYYKPPAPNQTNTGMDVHIMSVLSQVDDEIKNVLGSSPDAERISKLISSATNRVSGWPTHTWHQKNLPGFSTDVPRVLSDYGRSLSQYIARREAMHASNPYIVALNAAGKSNWSDYAKTYMREVTNPTGDMGTLREMLFHYYLAGKMSSALVNLSGYLTLGYPVVGRYTKNAAKYWTRGIREAFKNDAELGAELAGGLRLAKLEGVVADPTTQELLGTASGRSPVLRGLSDLAGAMFGKAETSIRRASYIAGHRIATEELGLAAGEAHEFAKRLVREANLDYTKADRPELIRAGWKAPFGTFRLFQANVLSKFKDAIKRGEYGTLARHLGTLGAVAGLIGMPGAKTLVDTARSYGYDIPTWVREKFGRGGEVAMRGLPYGAGALWGRPDQGIDLAGSAGVGDVVPTELFTNPLEGVGKLVAGVMADPFVRGPRAMRLAGQGEYYKAGEALMPEAVRAVSVATRAAQHGEFRTGFDEPIAPATPFDVGMRALGFQPTAVSRAYEREAAEKALRYISTGSSERFYRDIAKAIVNKDQEGLAAVMQAIAAHNEQAPPEAKIALGSTAVRAAIRRHVLQLTQPEITEMKSMPKKARGRFQLIQEVHK